MTTPHIHSEWEKEFDEEFFDTNLSRVSLHDRDPEDVKDFIKNLLTLSKKEANEEVIRNLIKKLDSLRWNYTHTEKDRETEYLISKNIIDEIESYAKQQGIEINNE